MIERLKNLLLKTLLYLLVIAAVAGAARYYQGVSLVQFLGPEKIYTVQPWILLLTVLLLWVAWKWLKTILLGLFVQLPSAISSRVRKGLTQRHHEHLHQGVTQLIRKNSSQALTYLNRYIKSGKDQDHAFHIWALGVHSFLSSHNLSGARALFDGLKKPSQLSATSEITWLLLSARLLSAEKKYRAALGLLVGGLSEFTDNHALAGELLALIENAELTGADLVLLTQSADQKIPRRIRESVVWKRLEAIERVEDNRATDEWIRSLPDEIRLHESFVLAHIRRLKAGGQTDACYRLAAEALHRRWSPKIAGALETLGRPEDENTVETCEALAQKYPEQTRLKAFVQGLRQ